MSSCLLPTLLTAEAERREQGPHVNDTFTPFKAALHRSSQAAVTSHIYRRHAGLLKTQLPHHIEKEACQLLHVRHVPRVSCHRTIVYEHSIGQRTTAVTSCLRS